MKTKLMKPGHKHPVNLSKLDRIQVLQPESPQHAIESLLLFDARCMDGDTQRELIHILPELVHIRRAWKAHYLENGCVSCHKKNKENTWYASGGFCVACQRRILMRMRNRYRKAMAGRDLPKELETFKDALALRYNAAQRLFNGED